MKNIDFDETYKMNYLSFKHHKTLWYGIIIIKILITSLFIQFLK